MRCKGAIAFRGTTIPGKVQHVCPSALPRSAAQSSVLPRATRGPVFKSPPLLKARTRQGANAWDRGLFVLLEYAGETICLVRRDCPASGRGGKNLNQPIDLSTTTVVV